MSEFRMLPQISLFAAKSQVSGLQCITRPPEGSAIDHLG